MHVPTSRSHIRAANSLRALVQAARGLPLSNDLSDVVGNLGEASNVNCCKDLQLSGQIRDGKLNVSDTINGNTKRNISKQQEVANRLI